MSDMYLTADWMKRLKLMCYICCSSPGKVSKTGWNQNSALGTHMHEVCSLFSKFFWISLLIAQNWRNCQVKAKVPLLCLYFHIFNSIRLNKIHISSSVDSFPPLVWGGVVALLLKHTGMNIDPKASPCWQRSAESHQHLQTFLQSLLCISLCVPMPLLLRQLHTHHGV